MTAYQQSRAGALSRAENSSAPEAIQQLHNIANKSRTRRHLPSRGTALDRTELTFNDRTFENDINAKIQLTEASYEKMMYKDALKSGFFELQLCLSRYREFCGADGLHRGLMDRFFEVQTLLLAPICPHICEHIWKTLLGHKESLMSAKFPVAGPIDHKLVQATEYLVHSLHEYRLKLKSYLQPAKGKTVGPAKPTHAIIWVAQSYPAWQTVVLKTIQGYLAKGDVLPDNTDILNDLKQDAEVTKHMKKVMPFVHMVKTNYEREGVKALKSELDFNEREVLVENLTYLKSTLELEGRDGTYTILEETR
ncbi:Leucine--tRNA ligase, cytoplasmic [Hypsibius exemplaris]|uniref:Leucine--tRNA ligase, cytoplasmic n=1 Tax=Hypsibius exemplaris TaxID=2072580 RepID=A0A9X6NM94_HYPEX|nr:Leucine--tRNA ligase, cytoplasmic [Hypsibius exemplaris]